MHFEIYQDESVKKQWRWKLLTTAGDDSNIANSGEGYDTAEACETVVRNIKDGAASASIIFMR